MVSETARPGTTEDAPVLQRLSTLDRFLPVWIIAAMLLGLALGRWVPGVDDVLSAVEFLRRFLLHVLPDGFQRIRHYGLHANRRAAARLERCREVLSAPPPPPIRRETTAEAALRLTGVDFQRCPACGERRLRVTLRLLASPVGAGAAAFDTS